MDVRDVLDHLARKQRVELRVAKRHRRGIEDGPGLLGDLPGANTDGVEIQVTGDDREAERHAEVRKERPSAANVERPPAGDMMLEEPAETLHLVLMQLGEKRRFGSTGVPIGRVLPHVERAQDIAIDELQQRGLKPDDLAGRAAHDELEVPEGIEREVGVRPALGCRHTRAGDRQADRFRTDRLERHGEPASSMKRRQLEAPPAEVSLRMRALTVCVDVDVKDVIGGLADRVCKVHLSPPAFDDNAAPSGHGAQTDGRTKP